MPSLSLTPLNYVDFIRRGYRSSEHAFRFIQCGHYALPDPWSAQPLKSVVSVTPESLGTLPFDILLIAYCFRSPIGGHFAAVSYTPKGSITQLLFPRDRVVIYDGSYPGSLDVAKRVVDSAIVAIESAFLNYDRIKAKRERGRVVAISDMIHNFGHQIINVIPAIRRLHASAVLPMLGGIWILGTEFFSNEDAFLPEWNGKVTKVSDRWALTSAIDQSTSIPVKIGSNVLANETREIILGSAQKSYSPLTAPQRWPLLGVSVRGASRCCRNLADIVCMVYQQLQKDFPDLGIILDGWVWADRISIPEVSGNCQSDLDIARYIANALPPGAIVDNVIGHRISASIVSLLRCHAYFSPVGTLQHKVAFFPKIKGVVHGPSSQLQSIDSNHYACEDLPAPYFLNPKDVVDVTSENERGAKFFDYEICNVQNCIHHLRACFQN